MTVWRIFTDGSCLKNPGPGGWCALLLSHDKEIILKGSAEQTTNNRMELMAVIAALTHLKHPQHIHLYTDSQYVKKGITEWIHQWEKNNWRTASKKPVQNKDLWQQLHTAHKNHTVEWFWVKAHAGHAENERVDKIAYEEAKKIKNIVS